MTESPPSANDAIRESEAVVIGYIALFAVAIQTGIIMIIFIRQALARRGTDTPYMESVLQGSARDGAGDSTVAICHLHR